MILNHIDSWQDVKDSCMTTINKLQGKYPDKTWKTKILISEHSPIRLIKIQNIWKNIKSWVSVHFVRHHVGITHFVSTQRDDRTGVDRDTKSQNALVTHRFEANAQSVIDISKKRICLKAHPETRTKWKEFLKDLKDIEPELYSVCVPSCVYRCGCSEFETCGYFQLMFDDIPRHIMTDINARYVIYHERSSQKITTDS